MKREKKTAGLAFRTYATPLKSKVTPERRFPPDSDKKDRTKGICERKKGEDERQNRRRTHWHRPINSKTTTIEKTTDRRLRT